MPSKSSNPKRNNEKRKEKSRVAARCRRTKEIQIFAELTAALPAKKGEVEQLDKASVMRLAISYLRVRDVVSMLPETETAKPVVEVPKGVEEVSSELSYMKALDGFVLVLSQQGDIIYSSENIADHLGISQMEIMGQSVFEFSHPCDHDEIREALRVNGTGRRDLLLRLKCTLTSKGRNVHLKSASYKVIHVTGHMIASSDNLNELNTINVDPEENKKLQGETDKKSVKTGSLVAIGRPIPHPSNIEELLDSKTFLTKHSLDMKFTYTDEDLTKNLGFEPDELNGQSLFDYHHAGDSASLVPQFKSLFSKGQCETGQYRFLAKSGGYAWVQTQATVINDKQQKPSSVVCVNYVISGIESKDEVFAAHQMQHADLKLEREATKSVASAEVPNGAIVETISAKEEGPIPVTELMFAPRPKEMNKGFFMFSQDEGLTLLKDEPEDLTHLAPTAGDACIPLENNSFELFDELLNNNYCLLGDDLTNGSPVDSLPGDSLLMSSPDHHETDSSCEQSSLLTDLSLDPFDCTRSDDLERVHSPFIPSNDDLPVLEPAVMWGALPENVSLARPQPTELQNTSPALQRLLVAPPTGPLPQEIFTNIYSDQGLMPSRSVSLWETGVKRVISKQDTETSPKRVKRSLSPASTPSPAKASSSVLMNLLDVQQRMWRVPPNSPTQYHQANESHFSRVPVNGNINYYENNNQIALNNNISVNNNIRYYRNVPNYPTINRHMQIPAINVTQSGPKQQILRCTKSNIESPMHTNIVNPMSPLTLNIGSPMYSLPSSPNTPMYSPAMSPVSLDQGLSPYSTPQSLSPVGRYNQVPSTNNKLLPPVSAMMKGCDPYLSNKMQLSPNYPLQPVDLLDSQLSCSDFWNESELYQGPNDLLSALDDVRLY